ncbi:MAG: HAD family hydrolase [Pontiellaceae bacterium]
MKVFLFDIGNVLCDFTYEKFLNKYEEISGKRVGMDGVIEEELYHAVERGDISDQTYVDRMNQHYKTSWLVEDLKQAWQQIFSANEVGRALYFSAIEKKVPVYALSNIAKYHISAINRNWNNFLSSATGLFLSYEMGFRKPDPRIYRMVLHQLQVPAEDCFFIDDLAENIEAARKIGMQAHQFIPENYNVVKEQASAFFNWV